MMSDPLVTLVADPSPTRDGLGLARARASETGNQYFRRTPYCLDSFVFISCTV